MLIIPGPFKYRTSKEQVSDASTRPLERASLRHLNPAPRKNKSQTPQPGPSKEQVSDASTRPLEWLGVSKKVSKIGRPILPIPRTSGFEIKFLFRTIYYLFSTAQQSFKMISPGKHEKGWPHTEARALALCYIFVVYYSICRLYCTVQHIHYTYI